MMRRRNDRLITLLIEISGPDNNIKNLIPVYLLLIIQRMMLKRKYKIKIQRKSYWRDNFFERKNKVIPDISQLKYAFNSEFFHNLKILARYSL